jgi:hypothetical protein
MRAFTYCDAAGYMFVNTQTRPGPTIVTAQQSSCPFVSVNPRATKQRVLRRYARARARGLMADGVRPWPTSSAPALYIALK